MIDSRRSVFWLLIGCGILFVPPDRALGQDVMDHVDMNSAEMTESELTREELLVILSSATGDDRIDLTSKRLSGLDLQHVDF